MRATILWVLATCAAQATAGDFRDGEGTLDLPDCASAKAWVSTVSGDASADDQAQILYGAQHCAKAGDAATARRLLALADTVPTASGPYFPHIDVQRVRVLLALGDRDPAAELMRACSRQAIERLRNAKGDEIWSLNVQSLQGLNEELARQLRASQPALAIEHQLYAADAFEFGGELGMPQMAGLNRRVALEIAFEAKLAEEALQGARGLVAFHQRQPDLSRAGAARIAASAVSLLIDAGRKADALALAQDIHATGWPDVDTYVRPFIERLRHEG